MNLLYKDSGGVLLGTREIARKYAEESRWKPPEKREEDEAPKKTPGREITLGRERRLANYKLPESLLQELERTAKKRGVSMTAIVEEALLEKLRATCESCGR